MKDRDKSYSKVLQNFTVAVEGMDMQQRDALICQAWQDGLTLQDIGDTCGLTRQRIYQIAVSAPHVKRSEIVEMEAKLRRDWESLCRDGVDVRPTTKESRARRNAFIRCARRNTRVYYRTIGNIVGLCSGRIKEICNDVESNV